MTIPSSTAPSIERIVVINDDAVQSGGAAMMTLASIRLLRARGYPVTALIGDDDADPILADLGVEVVPLGGHHILSGSPLKAALRGLYDATVYARLSEWLQANDTPETVYHLHNWHKTLSPSALLALRCVSPRLAMSTHDFFLACPNGGYFNYRQEAVCELKPMSAACMSTACDKRHYAHKVWRLTRHKVASSLFTWPNVSATVIAVHDRMVPLLERGGVPRPAITVVRNPVTPWLRKRVVAEQNDEVLYVGRLDHDKGIDVLLRAAKLIGAPLRIVGDGPMRTELVARHPEAIFMGRLSHEDIAAVARQARLLAVPTRVRETFGLVAIEGLMSGIPLVTTSSALIAEEIVAMGLGLAVPPGNAAALASSLSALMTDHARVASMSRSAFERAPALAPTEDQWCDNLLAVYRQKLAATWQNAETREVRQIHRSLPT